MKLHLYRKEKAPTATIGELFVDGKFECYTLEDVVRTLGPNGEGKVYGKTAIPAGTYKVTNTVSNRFKKLLPILHKVPHFEGVRIHPGNTSADTEGCILVGTTKLGRAGQPTDFIGNSRAAFYELFDKLKDAKDITITITDVPA